MGTVIGRTNLSLVLGDITEQPVDAVVNAANPTLMGGGGVDGAIHRAGGPAILQECRAIRERMDDLLPAGQAVITGGGRLKAQHVIHTVGPVWHGGDRGEPVLLAEAYRNSLKLAEEHGLKTIAFPSMSTGAYGYPVEQAAGVALKAVADYVKTGVSLVEVIFVLHDLRTMAVYGEWLAKLIGKNR